MNLGEIAGLLARYRGKSLLLDTNLLLLYLIGSVGRSEIARFKPVWNQGFAPDDFDLLAAIATQFSRLITTPHILTEVCNHSEKLKGPRRVEVFGRIAGFAAQMHEVFCPSSGLTKIPEFEKLGRTDVASARAGRH